MSKLDYPEEIQSLVAHFKRLPGIGPKSAERIAVWLLAQKTRFPLDLAQSIESASEAIQPCETCGFFATRGECQLCNDTTRDRTVLCVVEQPTDVLPLERTGALKGSYHCLGGRLSPLDGVTPSDLKIDGLLRRVRDEPALEEIILALSSDVEGEATANYITDLLKDTEKLTITRLAQGLPAGGGLESADELTLFRALRNRRSV